MKKAILIFALSAWAGAAHAYTINGVGTSTYSESYACDRARDNAEKSADAACKKIDATSKLSSIRFGGTTWIKKGDDYTCTVPAYYTCY